MKQKIRDALGDWRNLAKEELKKSNTNKTTTWKSSDGITYKSLYTEEDLRDLNHLYLYLSQEPLITFSILPHKVTLKHHLIHLLVLMKPMY